MRVTGEQRQHVADEAHNQATEQQTDRDPPATVADVVLSGDVGQECAALFRGCGAGLFDGHVSQLISQLGHRYVKPEGAGLVRHLCNLSAVFRGGFVCISQARLQAPHIADARAHVLDHQVSARHLQRETDYVEDQGCDLHRRHGTDDHRRRSVAPRSSDGLCHRPLLRSYAITEPSEMTYRYVVAELDPDGNPISYLRGLAVKEFGPELTYRLTPDQTQAWRFRDRESAQVQADRFNSSSANPHLTVTELAAADIA